MTTRSKVFGFTIAQKIRMVAEKIIQNDDPVKIAAHAKKISELLKVYDKAAERRKVSR